MSRKLLTLCLLIPLLATKVSALELELGLGKSAQPLYNGINPTKNPATYSSTDVGKVSLSHTFRITNKVGVKIWGDHYSIPFKEDPWPKGYGHNIGGVSVVVKIL
mgnify:CR=1 FL=1